MWGGTHNARGWFLTPGCDRACVQDDEPFDWETNAATNTGQGKRGAKGASHGSGREKDKERRERKEREREKRDKDKVRHAGHGCVAAPCLAALQSGSVN